MSTGLLLGWLVWGGCAAPTDPCTACADTVLGDETGHTGDTAPVEETGRPCGEDPELALTRVEVEPLPTLELARHVVVELDRPGAVAVLCEAEDDPRDRYLAESSDAASHRLLLTGLREQTRFRCAAVASCPTSPAGPVPFEIETGSADRAEGALEITRHDSLEPTPGFTLTNQVNLCEGRAGHALQIYDLDGAVRWSWLPGIFSSAGVESRYLGDGRVFWGGGRVVGVPSQVVHLDHTVEASTPFQGAENLVFHHEALHRPDGQALAVWESAPKDQGERYTGFELTLYDPATGKVSWSYGSQAGVEQGALDRRGSTGDVFHLNAAAWAEGSAGERVWLSLCNDESLLAVDPSTGLVTQKLSWRNDLEELEVSVVDDAGELLDSDAYPQCTHGIDADGDRLLVYDNGRRLDASRILEYAVDPTQNQATITWSWTEPDWWEPILGDADWIDEQRFLVVQGHNECTGDPRIPGDSSAVLEVDRDTGEVVWRMAFTSPEPTLYRAQRVDGCGIFSAARWCPSALERFDALAPLAGF